MWNDRTALEAAVAAGEHPRFIFFWRPAEAGAPTTADCLSQWTPSPFELDGERFLTAEHFMMAGKARLFGDEAARARILAATHPGEVQRIGREVLGFDADRWEAERSALVIRGNVLKFQQNPAMRSWLLATGTRVLVEASPVDRIWGIGLAGTDPRAADPRQWQGLNLLGFALMQARQQLRADLPA